MLNSQTRDRISQHSILLLLLGASAGACVGPVGGEGVGACYASSENDLATIAEQDERCHLVVENSTLTNLNALAQFTGVTDVSLYDNDELEDVSALAQSLAETTFLVAAQRSRLTVLDIPPGASGVSIYETQTESLAGSDATMQVSIGNAENLTSLSFPSTTTLQLTLNGLPNLETLDEAFPTVQRVTSLIVRNCPLLDVGEIEALAMRLDLDGEYHHCGNRGDGPCPSAE